jgi:membrane protease YdiL (CAAX protease family)
MAVSDPSLRMAKVLLGFVVLWVVLDQSANLLGSFRGEAGVLVCGLVLAAGVAVERVLFGMGAVPAMRRLGLKVPGITGLIAATVLSAALLAFFPVYALVAGVSMSLRDGWFWLVPGLFAQGGIAEEAVFRGYLFGHIREGRSFWRAAVVAAIPFVAVHLLLFATLPAAIAAASLLLSVSMSFPLAWLFERSGGSIWPPAVVHFTIQGAIKLVEVPDQAMAGMATLWIALAAIAPWSLFIFLRARH